MSFPRNGVAEYLVTDGMTERLCSGCKSWKPHNGEHFHSNATRATGLQARCKACQRRDCGRHANARYLAKTATVAAQMLTEAWPRQKHVRAAQKAAKRQRQ